MTERNAHPPWPRWVTVWFISMPLLLVAGGGYNDHQSCRRTLPARETLKLKTEIDAMRSEAYAAIDTNPAGVRVNLAYAKKTRVLAARLKVPRCWP